MLVLVAKHIFSDKKGVYNQMEKHIQMPATIENWDLLYDFLQKFIDETDSDEKMKNDVLVSAEEIFVNVSKYAYPEKNGEVFVEARFLPGNGVLCLKFTDQGIPFDPTKMRSPDISQGSRERKIGGLGIFMVRKMMDTMEYFYEDGYNNLLLTKKIKFV